MMTTQRTMGARRAQAQAQASDAARRLSAPAELTDEQRAVLDEALAFSLGDGRDSSRRVLIIEGAAGTGKSVVLARLFHELQARSADPRRNYLLVNHPEVLKIYGELAAGDPLVKKRQLMRPTSFVNALERQRREQAAPDLSPQADTVLVDEAHLLLSQPDHYNRFYGHDQLTSIIELARTVIVVYDPTQAVKTKELWTPERLRETIGRCEERVGHVKVKVCRLTRQLRMQAPEEVTLWVEAIAERGELRRLGRTDGGYGLRVFDDAQAMYERVRARDAEVGLSRVCATVNYPSRLDGQKHYVSEGRFRVPWDQYNHASTPWAELPGTIDEVGSIYTVQGFDLNYIGVIIGPGVTFEPAEGGGEALGRILVDTARITDREAYKDTASIGGEDVADVRRRLFLNALGVLLTRGQHGLYLYAHDRELGEALRQAVGH